VLIQGGYGVYAAPGSAATVINFGTIEGDGGDHEAVSLLSGNDRFIAEPGSGLVGSAYSVGATLEIAGGSGSIALSNVLGTLTGGVSMRFQQFETIILDTGGSWTLAGPATTNSAQIIHVANGATLGASGSIANGGTIELASGATNTDLRVQSAGLTLSNGGTILMSGSKARILGVSATAALDNLDNFISGSGFLGANELQLVNESFGIVQANQGTLTVHASGPSLVNAGLLESTSTGLLVLVSQTIDQTGGGGIVAAGKIDLQNDTIIGGTLATNSGGLIRTNSGTTVLNAATQAISLTGELQVLGSTTLIAAGSLHDSGKLNLYSGKLIVDSTGLTLSGGGQVNLNDSAKNVIVGATPTALLTNVNIHISGAGQLGGGSMALVNETAGVIVDTQAQALTINTGSNTIQNAGIIEADGKGGVTIASAVANTGTLLAVIGTLTLAGAVTGAGIGKINGGALYAKGAFSENVTFVGTTGVLKLGNSQGYAGSISGFSKSGTNSLDLTDIAFTSGVTKASYSGTTASGTLTVTDGTHTAHIMLVGNFTASTFTVGSDGHGGVLVKDPSAASLASRMAAMPAAPAMTPALAAREPPRLTPMLAAP
jgi:hypothetical protein